MLVTPTSLDYLRRIEVGQIILEKTGATHVDQKFLEWIRASVAAKHFAQEFDLFDGQYVLCNCVVGNSDWASGPETLPIFAEFLPRTDAGNAMAVEFDVAIESVRDWIGKAVATLIENASATDDDVRMPDKLELVYVSTEEVALLFAN
jgi:hypothetical protein